MTLPRKLLAVLLFSVAASVVQAGNTIGSSVAYMPKDQKAIHGLSEYEWEKVAGGDPVAEVFEPQVVKPNQLTASAKYAYQCVLKAGDIRERIHPVLSCLGYKGGAWLLKDLITRNDLTFGAETPKGVLQAIIEHFGLDAKVDIYTNQMVAFKPRESL